jgi:hypothetical protein
MLVEEPFHRADAYFQQESYLSNQQIYDVHSLMDSLIPTNSSQVYHGGSVLPDYGWQPPPGCSTHVAAIICEPLSHSINSALGGPPPNEYMVFNSAERRSFQKMKQEVSAFGRKHAEHARRYYQSTKIQPGYRKEVVAPIRPNYGRRQVTHTKQTQSKQGSNLLRDSVFKRSMNRSTLEANAAIRQVPVPVSSQQEVVLKVAKISSRPDKNQPIDSKTLFSFNERLLKNNVHEGLVKTPIDSEDDKNDIDLSNAPVFQILCEISKM